MRVVFFGTPYDAVPSLDALHDAGHDIALVVTQPDRRRGRRGNELVASPIKQRALELGLDVATPEKSDSIVDRVRALDAELGVVVAFGQILPPALLTATRSGCINLHFSLLPRWRGAAPVERALLAGDTETGVAIMAMEAGLDTGGIYFETRVPIDATATAGELRATLVAIGAAMLVRELDVIPMAVARPQIGDPVYARKLSVAEFRLDPTRPAVDLERIIRAAHPKPGAWVLVGGKRLKVLGAHVATDAGTGASVGSGAGAGLVGAFAIGEVSSDGLVVCGDGALVLDVVQPEGKKPMAARAWMAGMRETVTLDG